MYFIPISITQSGGVMRNLKDDLTILFCTCDSYEDLWYPFFKLFSFYWPENRCEIILNTESKTFKYDGLNIRSFSLGKSDYGKRMLDHIDKITTKYTLLLLDDFFLRKPVDEESIIKIIDFMEENEEVVAFTCDTNKYVEKDNTFMGFSKIKKYAPFKLNMQASIWKTSVYKKYWKPKDNPWVWEVFVNFLTFDEKDVFYSLNDWKNSPFYYGFNPEGMGVFRGKWVIEDVKPLFDNHNIIVDYSQRGIYVKEEAVNRLPILTTMPYVFSRIPFKYAFMFSIFEIYKRFCKRFRIKLKYHDYVEYLSICCNE